MFGGPTEEAQLNSGWKDFLAKLPEEGMREWWKSFVAQGEASRSTFPPEFREKSFSLNSWHLLLFGVHPDAQRKGVATALIEPVKTKAKAEGVYMCLETDTEKALSFYKGVGFVDYGKSLFVGYDDGKNPPREGHLWHLALKPEGL